MEATMEALKLEQPELYRTRERGWWVVRLDGRWWLVPAAGGGWGRRIPYRGRVSHLNRVGGDTARAGMRLVGVPSV